jgi:two-component system sensor histidine kinase QseC
LTTRKHRSLSQRLLLGLVAVNFSFWVVVAFLTVQDNIDEVHELYDVHLSHTALALMRLADPSAGKVGVVADNNTSPLIEQMFSRWPDLPDRLYEAGSAVAKPPSKGKWTDVIADDSIMTRNVEYGKTLRYQVWRKDGSLLLRSANAPESAITERLGYSDNEDNEGRTWRHYSLWDRQHDVRVIVSEQHGLRTQLLRSIAAKALMPVALGLPILILLLWWSIHRGLNPLIALSHEIAIRKPDSLLLLDETSVPREVLPIVLALNKLMRRMAHTLENERRFTDNAAHELRTPLAAIQAHLYAARSTNDKLERQNALDQVQSGLERSSRLVGQMLTLARLNPKQPLPDAAPVNLADLAQTVCAALAPLAMQRDQTLELHAEPDLPTLSGNADMLSMLLSNLVDNAIRYTPPGGHIDIVVTRNINAWVIAVCDDGPGIEPEQRERVFNRFYRLADQTQPGTGLGLAICRSIADLHRAQIVLSDGPNGRGLTASIIFSN